MSLKAGGLSKMTSLFEIKEIKNLTGNAPLSPSDAKTEVITCYHNEITFFIEKAKCALDHLISLKAKIEINKDLFDFEATGKIVELTALENNAFRIKIKMTQLDKKVWQKFIDNLNKTQDRADKILAAMKDEDS